MIGVDMGDTQKKAIEDGKEVGSVCQNPYGMGYATIVAGARASLGLESDKKSIPVFSGSIRIRLVWKSTQDICIKRWHCCIS